LPGKHITQRQELLYMQSRQSGLTQETGAAKAGISVRSAHRLEHDGPRKKSQRLDEHHPEDYPYKLLHTLQRRVKHWRATQGPNNPVMFRQSLPPGQQAQADALPSLKSLQAQYLKSQDQPELVTKQHDIADYDKLLSGCWIKPQIQGGSVCLSR